LLNEEVNSLACQLFFCFLARLLPPLFLLCMRFNCIFRLQPVVRPA